MLQQDGKYVSLESGKLHGLFLLKMQGLRKGKEFILGGWVASQKLFEAFSGSLGHAHLENLPKVGSFLPL